MQRSRRQNATSLQNRSPRFHDEEWLYYWCDDEDRAYRDYPIGTVVVGIIGTIFLALSIVAFF